MEMPDQPIVESDVVLQYLMGIALAEKEQDFRGIIENISRDPANPQMRDIVIATVAVLMGMGGISWPVIMLTLRHLCERSEDDLKQDAVAIINGAFLLLPDKEDSVRRVDLSTLRDVGSKDMGPAFVSTVYSLTAVWEKATTLLGT